MTRPQLILVISASTIVLFFVLLFTGLIPGLKPDPSIQPPPAPVTQIKVWVVKDGAAGLQSVISNYHGAHPEVNITYNIVSESNYENNLIDNLAAGTGPDIFMLQNSWLPKYLNKISPSSSTLVTGAKVNEIFPPIVGNDFVLGGQVWGLPLAIDTLALAYNRSIFDSKQLVLPPTTWDEVKNMVPRIRETNSGVITKSAVAMGGGNASVTNATDILSAILLQLKNKIIDPAQRRAVINRTNGLEALNMYVSFSDPTNALYTWDAKQSKNSINSFIDGKTAMALVYKRDVNEIKTRNPVLNLLIAPLPQFDAGNPISIGNYWGLVVANQSANKAAAWDFINYAATNIDANKTYLAGSGLPPALRALIPEFMSDPFTKVFASQVLTAQSVPFIQYPPVLEALNNMIESTLLNPASAPANLKSAEDKINAIIQ